MHIETLKTWRAERDSLFLDRKNVEFWSQDYRKWRSEGNREPAKFFQKSRTEHIKPSLSLSVAKGISNGKPLVMNAITITSKAGK